MSETLKTSPFMVRSFRSIQKNSHLKEKSPIKPLHLGRGGDFSEIFSDLLIDSKSSNLPVLLYSKITFLITFKIHQKHK
ncbi:MAG: hypothetical protein AABW83_03610 [Nanoarchaeota archaeon]